MSGIFFTADILPDNIRHFALYNPLLQLNELFRSAFFTEYESNYLDLTYLIGFTLVALFVGLEFEAESLFPFAVIHQKFDQPDPAGSGGRSP